MPNAKIVQHSNNEFQLLVPHPREDRKADEPLPEAGRDRQVGGPPAEGLLIVRMQMERPPVHRASDAGFFQLLEELVSIDREQFQSEFDRKKMPGVNAVCVLRRQLDLSNVRELLEISSGDRLPFLPH